VCFSMPSLLKTTPNVFKKWRHLSLARGIYFFIWNIEFFRSCNRYL